MKRLFFLFMGIFLLTLPLTAQFNEKPVLNIENKDKKFLNYGYYLGINQYDFKFDYKNNDRDILVDKSLGFTVGLIGEMRLNEFLDLRFEPGLAYNLRTLGFPGFDVEQDALREVKSTYINFPLLLKVSTRRLGNFKPFIIGGGSASLNLGSNESSLDDNSSGTFRMTKWVYNYELGFGIDFYLEYFKFTPSIRGVFAITDELVPDNDANSPWTGNIDALRTRGLFINFTFE
ncbi:PorT family protein [Maribacter algarum]|uniref:PorT family protein n=1 Tax=Maribacter algarum (ex Zhang et al. 2020) TaxID=2578118 RepID=A0A5S3PNW1_9FLAO|nr:porin family protein [Maribacter algarum]TMM56168.1 PorT family protein [Maribacter algarum]